MKRVGNILTFLIALFAIGSFVYYHGFQCSHEFRSFQILAVKVSFLVFLIAYLAQCWLSPSPFRFMKSTPFEGLLISLVTVETLLTYFTPYSLSGSIIDFLDPVARTHVLILLYQSVLVLLAFIELGKRWSDVNESVPFTLSPAWLFVFSYVLLIVGGSCLLKMPEMTVSGESMPLIDALFTSVSANCVTGLIVVDTATYFSVKGQALLMFLIQLGGLNIISFAVYFAFFFQKEAFDGKERLAEDFLHLRGGPNLNSLVMRVVAISVVIEISGAVLLFFQWQDSLSGFGRAKQIFFSLFHSISAFNNAGFTLFTGNLENPVTLNNYGVHTTIAVLIVLGGLGFPVIANLLNWLRRRRQLTADSKISISSAIVLILAGAILIAVIEPWSIFNGTAVGSAVFQSITSRTAGFNTISLNALSTASIVLIMVLMFIGAGSASTGGGIKTSTFTVAVAGILSRVRGSTQTSIFGENISPNLMKRAFLIIVSSIAVITTGAILLIVVEPSASPMALVFEAFSAFGTVGLSLDTTPGLTTLGKVIVMILIFLGRVGPLALAAGFLSDKRGRAEVGNVVIG